MDTTNTPNVITDYTPFFSKIAKARKPSPIRELIKYTADPSVLSLGGGLPNPTAFPFQKVTVELKNQEHPLVIEGEMLATALQYTPTYGIPKLLSWLKELQVHNHKLEKNSSQWNIGVTSGSQEGLALVIDCLLNEGDSLICESPTYSGTLSILTPKQLNLVGIPIDANGISPVELENTLTNWSTLYPSNPFPRVIYLIPTGQNPSGSTMTTERKRQIYSICSRFNLLILEDDPYYYLQFESTELNGATTDDTTPILGVSMLSMDVDKRVIRFDSLSKILSSGLRVGFVTGPFALVEKMQVTQQASTLHASGISQTFAIALLYSWGIEGFHRHVASVQRFYKERRQRFIECVERHLHGLVEYKAPSAGMFVWFKVLNTNDTFQMISTKALEKKVVLVPGVAFYPDQTKQYPYVRASFSVATNEQMDEACKRFASLIKESI